MNSLGSSSRELNLDPVRLLHLGHLGTFHKTGDLSAAKLARGDLILKEDIDLGEGATLGLGYMDVNHLHGFPHNTHEVGNTNKQ